MEGVLVYDVIFFVRTADGLSKVIVNLEAQKSEPVKYDVEMRGIFYAAREISAQLEREFAHQQYNGSSRRSMNFFITQVSLCEIILNIIIF